MTLQAIFTKCPECSSELRGSELTPFVDAFFMQQRAETRQLNSKLTAFYYNSVLIIMLYDSPSHSH